MLRADPRSHAQLRKTKDMRAYSTNACRRSVFEQTVTELPGTFESSSIRYDTTGKASDDVAISVEAQLSAMKAFSVSGAANKVPRRRMSAWSRRLVKLPSRSDVKLTLPAATQDR